MRLLIGTAAFATLLVAAPAYATTGFATFEQPDGTDTVSFSAGTLADTNSTGGVAVLFNYLDPMPPALDGQIAATMNFNAASGGGGYGGALSFLRTSDSANLLTVTFTDAVLSGLGTASSLLASQPGGGTVTFTSDFFDFSTSAARDFSLSFAGLSHAFGSSSWSADASGVFASDERNPNTGIPEPATWAMMITGFAGVGALVRRRRIATDIA